METFDYVIIGAGSAGSVLANRLGEDPGSRVCVLEAGPSDWHPYIHLPAGFIKTFHMKSINWAYQQEPGPWTGGRSIYAPRGKTLGGSSSINGHIYNRGQRQDFDTWAQLGNRGWGYPDILPYFKRMERRVGECDDTYRGREGSLTVTTMDWQDPLCEAFMEGAVSLGIPRNPDYNGAIQEGVSYCQRTIENGLRMSAAKAFLHPARKRGTPDQSDQLSDRSWWPSQGEVPGRELGSPVPRRRLRVTTIIPRARRTRRELVHTARADPARPRIDGSIISRDHFH